MSVHGFRALKTPRYIVGVLGTCRTSRTSTARQERARNARMRTVTLGYGDLGVTMSRDVVMLHQVVAPSERVHYSAKAPSCPALSPKPPRINNSSGSMTAQVGFVQREVGFDLSCGPGRLILLPSRTMGMVEVRLPSFFSST